jgi:hypothetical protein
MLAGDFGESAKTILSQQEMLLPDLLDVGETITMSPQQLVEKWRASGFWQITHPPHEVLDSRLVTREVRSAG